MSKIKHLHRLSVWSYRDDPDATKALCRKSDDYCRTEVTSGRAQWVISKAGLRIGIQTLSPEEISKRSREPKIPSLGGRTSISNGESRLNAESHGKSNVPVEELDTILRGMSARIEQQIERALSEGRSIPHKVRVLNAHAKVTAYPVINESCQGAKAPMVAVGLCPA